jgi:hypothetical protein
MSLRDKIKEIDSFGSPLNFNIRGSETNKTILGGYITILIFGATAYLAASSFVAMIGFNDTYNYKSFELPRQDETMGEEFILYEYDYMMTFAFYNNGGYGEAPKDIGSFYVQEIIFNNFIFEVAKTAPLVPCSDVKAYQDLDMLDGIR